MKCRGPYTTTLGLKLHVIGIIHYPICAILTDMIYQGRFILPQSVQDARCICDLLLYDPWEWVRLALYKIPSDCSQFHAVLSLFSSYSSSFCHQEKAHGIGFHTARMYVSPLFFSLSLCSLNSTQSRIWIVNCFKY